MAKEILTSFDFLFVLFCWSAVILFLAVLPIVFVTETFFLLPRDAVIK